MKTLVLLVTLGSCALVTAGQEQQPAASGPLIPGGLRDFDLRGDARALFEKVAGVYGFRCVFDADYDARKPIRFQLTQVDYRLALRALEEATRSFVTPLSANEILVASDTPDKRRNIEPFVAMTVDIPQAMTPQELTEIITAVQQVMALEKVGVATQQNRVVLRGPVSKVVPARVMFEGLLHYQPQVAIELQLLEVSRNDMLTYGLSLPSSFPIINFNSASNVATTLASLARNGVGGMAFGIGITSSQLVAQMQQSNGSSLLHVELRSLNHKPVTFHVGDRYPILTASYVGGSVGSDNGTGGSNNGTTNPPTVFGDVSGPAALTIIDVNQDGVADLVAAASTGNAAAVLLGNSDGTFQTAVTYPAGTAPSAIAAADLNQDGFIDLITANSGSDDVSVLLGKGDGTFDAAVQYKVGTHPSGLAVIDINQDGFTDIVTGNANSNNISILLGKGDGAFQSALAISAGSGPSALIATDLNGDGWPDLAVVNATSNNLLVFLSDTKGGFQTPTTYATGNGPSAIITADLNRDGHADLVIANKTDNTVSIFLGDGTGAFATTGVAYPAGTGPVSLGTEDSNLDGLTDIVVANPNDGAVSLLLGFGDGSFQTPIAFQTGTAPTALITRDLNNDGVLDVVAANTSSNNFSLLLGSVAGGFHDSSGNPLPATGGQTYTPTPSFNFEDLGLVVKATPHVHGMTDVTLELDTEFKLLTGQVVSGIPVISNRKLTSQVCLPYGEWVMVAGLLTTSDAYSISGLPLPPPIGQRTRNRGTDAVLVLIKTNLLSLPQDEFVNAPLPLGSDTRPRSPL